MSREQKITVTRQAVLHRGHLRPIRDHYYCTGPDGRRFDNSSLATLRDVLRRKYGTVRIVKAWEAQPEGQGEAA